MYEIITYYVRAHRVSIALAAEALERIEKKRANDFVILT